MSLPKLGLTTGDPAGIGPEISLRAAQDPSVRGSCCLFLFGDFEILRSQAYCLGLPFDFERISPKDLAGSVSERAIVHIPADAAEIQPGTGSKASGEAAARNILACAEACKRRLLQAMVTAPLNKAWLKEAGYPYPGHTEFLAHLTGTPKFAMAFLTDRLNVVLATIHLPLAAAIKRISAALIFEKLSILLTEFPRLGLPCSEVAVAAMNPHAGEGGLMGAEETETIDPAIDQARARFPNVRIHGPIPADTLFYRAAGGEFDAVLALYHDQGLSPIKLIGFGEAVNLTLGLPFVRTSVDHGTAYDIAGKGMARHQSMVSAIRWALRLTKQNVTD